MAMLNNQRVVNEETPSKHGEDLNGCLPAKKSNQHGE